MGDEEDAARLQRFLHDLIAAELHDVDTYRERHMLYRREEYEDLPAFRAMRSSGRQNLERYEEALNFLFEQCGVKLGHLQASFMRGVMAISLHRMFGTQLLANMAFLREKFGAPAAARPLAGCARVRAY